MKATVDLKPYCDKCPYMSLDVTHPEILMTQGKIVELWSKDGRGGTRG